MQATINHCASFTKPPNQNQKCTVRLSQEPKSQISTCNANQMQIYTLNHHVVQPLTIQQKLEHYNFKPPGSFNALHRNYKQTATEPQATAKSRR